MACPTAGASIAGQAAYKPRYSKAAVALIEELRQRCKGELRKGALFAKHGRR